MPEIYQAKLLNPAHQQSCKTVIGLPILSSVYLNYTNTNISYNKVFSDKSLTEPHILNPENFIKKLSNKNYLSLDAHIHFFSLGIKKKAGDFSFDITDKINIWFGFPKTLLGLPLYGNGHPDYLKTSLNGLGVDFSYYREFAFGFSRQINEYYTLGVKAKLLFGNLNLYTKTLDAGLNTDEEDFSLTLFANTNINASLPIIINEGATGNISGISTGNLSLTELLLNFKNPGMAIDVGTIYNYDDNTKFYASIIDFGAVRWRTNLTNIRHDGKFTFSGLENILRPDENSLSGLLDSLYNEFLINVTHERYTSYLPLQLYFGSTYNLFTKLTIGALNRNLVYNKKIFPSITFSANYQVFKSMKIALGYSIINRSFNNIGLTWYIGRQGLQFYVSQDNNLFLPVNGAIYQATGKMSSRVLGFQNYNLRFGFNLIFGCREKAPNYNKLACPWMLRMDPEWLKNKEYYPKHQKKPGKFKKK